MEAALRSLAEPEATLACLAHEHREIFTAVSDKGPRAGALVREHVDGFYRDFIRHRDPVTLSECAGRRVLPSPVNHPHRVSTEPGQGPRTSTVIPFGFGQIAPTGASAERPEFPAP